MPYYDFVSDDPVSPYHEKPKTIYMTMSEYEVRKDSEICEITKSKLRRIFNDPPMAKFKGTGFYCTDKK